LKNSVKPQKDSIENIWGSTWDPSAPSKKVGNKRGEKEKVPHIGIDLKGRPETDSKKFKERKGSAQSMGLRIRKTTLQRTPSITARSPEEPTKQTATHPNISSPPPTPHQKQPTKKHPPPHPHPHPREGFSLWVWTIEGEPRSRVNDFVCPGCLKGGNTSLTQKIRHRLLRLAYICIDWRHGRNPPPRLKPSGKLPA